MDIERDESNKEGGADIEEEQIGPGHRVAPMHSRSVGIGKAWRLSRVGSFRFQDGIRKQYANDLAGSQEDSRDPAARSGRPIPRDYSRSPLALTNACSKRCLEPVDAVAAI